MSEIKDGTYSVDVRLDGGSGRAKVESPARLTVKNGELKAEIRWDSPYYDYMEVEGREYLPANGDGNSVFVIDAELDRPLSVKAETVAMSQPHVIDYTLYLDSATLRGGGHLAAVCALVAAAAFALVMTLVIKKRKKHEK